MVSKILLFLCLLPTGTAQANCKDFFQSQSVSNFTADLNSYAKSPIVWSNFKVTNEAVLISNLDDGQCYILFQKNHLPKRFELKTPAGLGDWNYDYVTDTSPSNEGLRGVLREQGVKAFTSVSLESWSVEDGSAINILIHEGFHFLAQEQIPAWDYQPDRDILPDICNKNNKSQEDLFKKEALAIIAALEKLTLSNNKLKALELAKQFISLRERRYAESHNLKVPTGDWNYPNGISCFHAESIMEYEEGAAQFAGDQASIESKKTSWSAYISETKDLSVWLEPYYQFGSLQLLFIWKLGGTQIIREISIDLEKSNDWKNSVFGQFKKFVESQ